MGDIKTRDLIKDVKVLDKTKGFNDKMKSAYVRTKKASDSIHIKDEEITDFGNEKIDSGKQKLASGISGKTRGGIKKSVKSIKRAKKTTKYSVKTTTKATQKTAKATTRAAKRTVKAVKATTKFTVAATKLVAKITASIIKAIIAALKSLIAAIAAGGWVAVVVIAIIAVVILLIWWISSIFGGEKNEDTDMSAVMEAVMEINDEYLLELEEIKNSNSYDVLEVSGSRAAWKDVLAIYATCLCMDPLNPQDASTMDEGKKQLLRTIFWDMNSLSYSLETKTETEIIAEDDGKGNLIYTETQVTRTYLRIKVSHLTSEEASQKYELTNDQRDMLDILLAPESDKYWTEMMYGIPYGSSDIVEVAASQIGNVGGEPYWSWAGYGSRVEWCGCFVSWCAYQCGYIDMGVIPNFVACEEQARPWFEDRGQWVDGSTTPTSGMLVFFDWNGEGLAQHVGIVESVENGYVNTIEGNTSDSCARRKYAIGDVRILGYGVVEY